MPDSRLLVPTARQVEVDDTPPDAVDHIGSRRRLDAGASPDSGSRERAWKQTLRDADPRRIPGPKAPLLVFGAIGLLGQVDDATLGAMLPEIRAELGLSNAMLATISSVTTLAVLALGIPFGHLADRVKRVWLLRASVLGSNAASIVQATAPGVGQLVAGRLVGGVAVGLGQPSSFSYLADVYRASTRTRVFGFMFIIAGVGQILGPIIGGVAGEAFGWRVALGGLGLLALVVGMLTFLLREPVRGVLDRLDAGADPEAALIEQEPLPLGEALRAAWSIRTVRRIVISTPFLYLKGAVGLGLLSVYYAEVFVLTPTQRGLVFSTAAALGIVALLFGAPLGDRLLATRPSAFLPLAGIGAFIQAGSLAMLGFTDNAALAIAISLPISALDLLLAPAFFSLISQVVPARVRGLGLQIVAPGQLLGLIAYPVMVGFVDRIGLQRGIALFAIPTFIGGLVLIGGGPGTVRDRRTALAAGVAEAEAIEARQRGRTPVLVVRDLEAGYGSAPVLTGIDLDVAAGELVAIIGPNGAGKTTLLRAIAGVRPATSGAVAINGVESTTSPAHRLARRGVALVPGGQAVLPGVSVEEHLAAAARLGVDDADDGERDVVAAVARHAPALADRLYQLASTLSGGEQQLLALACAAVARPSLLLVDELSLGLSPTAVREALSSARRAADAGAAVVVVEQSVEAVLSVADRVLVLEKGEVVFAGTPEELRERPGALAAVALGGVTRSARARTRPRIPPPPTTTSGDAAALRCSAISVSFGGLRALADVSLAVDPGEVLGIIGPNGAGKTTLFDVISGFLAGETGSVSLAGADATALAPHERARLGLGRTFQRARLFPGLSVRDAVLAALDRRAGPGASLAPLGLPGARRAEARLRRRADGTLEVLGLDRWADVAVGDLPAGTRRLVSLACTLAFEPTVVLLDEPTAGLSRLEAEEVPVLIRRTARETGAAVVVIEHDVPLLAASADRFVAMVGGAVVSEGTPDEVVNDPVVLAAYLGTGDAAEDDEDHAFIRSSTPAPAATED